MATLRLTPRRAAVAAVLYLVTWPCLKLALDVGPMGTLLWRGGLFLMGLAWVVWFVERVARGWEDARRAAAAALRRQRGTELVVSALPLAGPGKVWNPLDLEAWYYGVSAQRLKQSLALLAVYTLMFLAVVLLIDGLKFGGKSLSAELPSGGGGDGRAGDAALAVVRPKVQVKKVVRKKFVINPYSGIIFNAPPIEKVDLRFNEETKSEYQVGQGSGLGQGFGVGSGSGPGFGTGTGTGKVRLFRLKYEGGDWDNNFGPGKDQNMLHWYARESQDYKRSKTAEKSEFVSVPDLAHFPADKAPPLVILGGQRAIILSKSEKRILHDYLIEKHGMILGDNGGSRQFHDQFFTLMHEVTDVDPVPLPLDDIIHRSPFRVPFLPFVAPHGGKVAYGWKIDGRWLAIYHPGDLMDAWADGHSGVKADIAEACYMFGANVIFYAYKEYHLWLESRRK